MTFDPDITPLLAPVTEKGHHIGAADENNFEFGLECILDHAGRLIDERHGREEAPHARQAICARSGARATRSHQSQLDLDDDGAALAAACTHRGDTDAAAPAPQLVDQRGDHARARRRDGMAEAATTSGEVHQLLVDARTPGTPRSAPTRTPR